MGNVPAIVSPRRDAREKVREQLIPGQYMVLLEPTIDFIYDFMVGYALPLYGIAY
jgi:hypothetical protein